MRNIAIFIAVEEYTDQRIPSVGFAETDARELARAFDALKLESYEPHVLLNSQSTCTTIQSNIRTIMQSLGDEDVLYLYYAGHGFSKNGSNYITCSDTYLDDLENTSIPIQWVLDTIRKSACKKSILFLDSCESGMFANANMRGIFSDLTEKELHDFFETAQHCVCFSACKPGEKSYSSPKLKHGIWTYHLTEALSGRAPEALENNQHITSASLRNYLSAAVPKALRETHTGTRVQTPWSYGASNSEFLVADIAALLRKQTEAVDPSVQQLLSADFLGETSLSIKSLSGFQKYHTVPDSVSSYTEGFVASISAQEIQEDIADTFKSLRETFGLKRKEAKCEEGSIITPYFDYEVTIRQDQEDPADAVMRRTVTNIRTPDQIDTEQFNQVFMGQFDTLELSVSEQMSVEDVIDTIEDMDDESIRVDYDQDANSCTISADGLDCEIIVGPHAISIVRARGKSPSLLLESFFNAQKLLVNTHGLNPLPFK